MTNKTITMSLELAENLLHCGVTSSFIPPGTVAKLRAALADPVPPVGVDVEVLAWIDRSTDSGVILTLTGEKSSVDNIGLVDRAHVTRLQAEVEQWKANNMANAWAAGELVKILRGQRDALKAEVERLQDQLADAKATANLATTNLKEFKEDHQAELAKVRKLISNLRSDTQSGYLKAVQALHNWANQSAPRGYSNIVMTGTSCNQSAPADKDEVHCTGYTDYDWPTRPHEKGD